MNEQIKEKWVWALESGKYKQATKCLNTGEGMCCLGVLTDLYIQENQGAKWEPHTVKPLDEIVDDEDYYPTELLNKPLFRFEGNGKTLDKKVQDWAGIEGENPAVVPAKSWVEGDDPINQYDYFTLATLNDSGLTFSQIADVIKYAL